MRIWRLELNLYLGKWDKPRNSEYNCSCREYAAGPFQAVWLSCECMAGIYEDLGRKYRIRRYLKVRKLRQENRRRMAAVIKQVVESIDEESYNSIGKDMQGSELPVEDICHLFPKQ